MVGSLFNQIFVQFGVNLSNIKNVAHLLVIVLVLQQAQGFTQELSPEQNAQLRAKIRYLKEHHMESMSDEWIIMANKYEKKLLSVGETKKLSDVTIEVTNQFLVVYKITQVLGHMYEVSRLAKNIQSLIDVGENEGKIAELSVPVKSLQSRAEEADQIINEIYSTTNTTKARELMSTLKSHVQKTRISEYNQTMESIGKFKDEILVKLSDLDYDQKVNYLVQAVAVIGTVATAYYATRNGIGEYQKYAKEITSMANKESLMKVGAPLAATGALAKLGTVAYGNIRDNAKLKSLLGEQFDRLVKVGVEVMKMGDVIDSDEAWIKGDGSEHLEKLVLSKHSEL